MKRTPRNFGFLGPLVVLILLFSVLGVPFHHHGEFYSQRICPVCVTVSQLEGAVEEVIREFPEPLISFTIQPEARVPNATDRIADLYTRSPPSF